MNLEHTIMNKTNLFVGLFTATLVAIGIIGFSKVNVANAEIAKESANYTISKTWELPTELNEVSGIVWVDDHTLACVQDENGIIFLYDLIKGSVTDKIPFAGNGDYEGIALHNTDIYVMQSDGLLYEIKNWSSTNKTVTSYQTGFNASNNMESLTYSAKDNCLLTASKNKDSYDHFKAIYKISLSSKSADIKTPAYKIELNAAVRKEQKTKKSQNKFSPSEIAVHPLTNDIYVLEGKNPKLVILDASGTLKSVYTLDESNFPQPEGMTFSRDGDLYISNESGSGPATIHLVTLK